MSAYLPYFPGTHTRTQGHTFQHAHHTVLPSVLSRPLCPPYCVQSLKLTQLSPRCCPISNDLCTNLSFLDSKKVKNCSFSFLQQFFIPKSPGRWSCTGVWGSKYLPWKCSILLRSCTLNTWTKLCGLLSHQLCSLFRLKALWVLLLNILHDMPVTWGLF